MDPKIWKAVQHAIDKSPFLGYFLLTAKIEAREGIGTMGVTPTHIYYEPEWVDTLTMEQTAGVLAHEAKHQYHLHHLRRGDRDKERWNIACDAIINLQLISSGWKLPPNGVFMDNKYINFSAEEIYEIIETIEVQCPIGSGDMEDGGEEAEEAKAKIKANIQQAKELAGEDKGDVPTEAQRILDEDIKVAGEKSWRELLFEKTGAMKTRTDYTWTTPNRRHWHRGSYLPSWKVEQIAKVGVGIDTSGSISQKLLSTFFAEIKLAFEQSQMQEVVFFICDARLHATVPVTKQEGLDKVKQALMGGGGTSFIPVFEEAVKHNLSTLFYFTDLMGHFPNNIYDFETVWVAYNTDHNAPFGTTIHMGRE